MHRRAFLLAGGQAELKVDGCLLAQRIGVGVVNPHLDLQGHERGVNHPRTLPGHPQPDTGQPVGDGGDAVRGRGSPIEKLLLPVDVSGLAHRMGRDPAAGVGGLAEAAQPVVAQVELVAAQAAPGSGVDVQGLQLLH